MSKSVPVGLTNLVYAIMTADTPPTSVGGTDGSAVYDSTVRVLGAITANFSPNASNDTLFADDGPYETASTLGAMTLELNVADIPPEQRKELLGAEYDEATGLLINSAEDTPPWVAVGMAIKKSNGASRYVWYLKGKFAAPDDNNQTKADSINWNTPTITGNFAKRDADGAYRYAIETDDPNADPTMLANWFDDPNVGARVKCAAVTSDAPSGDLSKAAVATITLACITSGASIEYKWSTSNIWLAYSAPIATSGLTADTTVILNTRAQKAGLLSSTTNFTYAVTA